MANKEPKVLFIDIETSPLVGYSWGTYQQNVLKVLQPSKIISVAWKWAHEDFIHCKALPDYRGYKPGVLNDFKLVQEVWKVLDRADIVVAHHGDSFDIKKLNARFVAYNLNAPTIYQTIDTRKVAFKHFRFDSNSLNDLGQYLGEGKKVETGGFDLWVKCIAGDADAWEKMKIYNVQDVELLHRIYLRLRPFMTNHPNMNIIAGEKDLSCHVCLSHNIQKRGFSITHMGRKQRYQCRDCGSWSSGPYQRANVALR